MTGWLGSFPAILLAGAIVLAWVVGGFFVKGGFGNDGYHLVLSTSATVVTLIMVFIIQNTQNRDDRAVQTKLDAHSEALSRLLDRLGIDDTDDLLRRLVGVEDAPHQEIKNEQDEVRDGAKGGAAAA